MNDVYKIQRSHKDNGSESRQRVNREMCGSGNIDKNMNKPINKKCSVCPLSVLDSCDEMLDKTTREMFIKRVIVIIKRVHNISEVMAV